MVPPDGARARRLPTLTWDSIVDDEPLEEQTAAPSTIADPSTASSGRAWITEESSPPAPSVSTPAPSTSPMAPALGDPAAPVTIAPMTLGPLLGADTPADAPVPVDPSPAPTASPAPPPRSTPTPPPPPIRPVATPPENGAAAPDRPAEPVADAERQPVAVRLAPPATIIPALGTVDIGPADVNASPESLDGPPTSTPGAAATTEPDVEPVSTELPEIREATPVPVPAAAPAPADSPGLDYSLPRLAQPDQRQQTPLAAVAYHPFEPEAQPVKPAHRNKRARSGFKLVLTLVVLAALVTVGIVFGRPYLFPNEWDAGAQPYVEPIESARGVEFTDPFVVTAEPTAEFDARVTAQLTGNWNDEMPAWRALGLLNGPANRDTVAELLTDWQDATYEPSDGDVYYDETVQKPALDAAVTRAMAQASLDQEFGWSLSQARRTLDGAAATSGEVLRQSRQAQAATEFTAPLRVRETAPLAFLPPVLGYKVYAPMVYSEFPQAGANGANALAGIGAKGPGPLGVEQPTAAPNPVALDGDRLVSSATVMDRSFWYLAFAGYLDAATAHAASEAVVENSVMNAERGADACVYATFAGGDVAQNNTLRSALEQWSASVPSEFSSSTGVLPDGTLQLVSCDPGVGFDNGSRLGVARELAGWRMAELATTAFVADANGNDAQLAASLAAVDASDVGVRLANLAFDTTPVDAAQAARDMVAAVLTQAG